MKSKMPMLILAAMAALFIAAVASGCGSGVEEALSSEDWARQSGAMVESVVEREAELKVASAPQPPAAPAAMKAQAVIAKEVLREVELSAPTSVTVSSDDIQTQTPAQLVTQRRIIVRTVNMVIVVGEIQDAIDDISQMADILGGWVVSTDRREKHSGVISVRVLAASLDSAIEMLREMAEDVESEVTTSQDVTDEYFDLQARLRNQQATEDALIRLLDRAESVEHALAVQRELSSVQENVERLLGRIKLLEETSAFSLITVSLKLAPVDMGIDAGPDQSVAAYTPTRFRATFTPPEEMDNHVVTWDFGDGSDPVIVVRTAPTTNEGELVTATVTHEYGDPKDSPFIVQVSISSYGKSGVAEGEDTLIVTVSETPVIEVFASAQDNEALQNEVVEFSGSFTRPPGLSNVRYQWDFGDGSPPEEGELAGGITRVDAAHAYADYRSTRYRARFTVTADSEVGEIISSDEIRIRVDEDPGLIVGGFDVGENAKTAVRALSLALSGLTTVAIWVGVFAIIWAPLAVVIVILVRRGRRFRAERPAAEAARPDPQDEPGPGVG